MPHSVWRRVRARVHLSLTPVELSNPVRSATKKAFSSLLMRYSPELGGAVVAHIGPVELCGPPAFIDASPFAHVAAIANLLVFAPTKGTELLGVVTHVGPDHLGLSVLSAFHAVLPIDHLEDVYRFESKYTTTTTVHMWKRIDGHDHITVRRQLRFVASELKPTRTGLFQIIASLDPNLRHNSNNSHPLGLIPREKEFSLSTRSPQQGSDTVETEHNDVLQVTKRSSAGRANEHLTGDELLTAGNDTLGDALMPTGTPVSALKKKKKKRRSEAEARSVSFEGSGRQKQDKQVHESSEQPRSQETVSQEMEDSEDKEGSKKGLDEGEKVEKSDRKKRKKDKKKKKKRSSSGDGEKQRESNGSIKMTKDGNEEEEMNSSLPAATKDKDQQATNEVTSTGNGEVQRDSKEQEGEGHRSHKKKSKKKRREKGGSRDGDTGGVVKTEGTAEDEEKVNREISMRRDAEKAVELGPMGDEEKKDEKDENERDTEGSRKKKKKKKRRRSSEGETDEHRSKKKKRKKRMSEAMELERKRSMQQYESS